MPWHNPPPEAFRVRPELSTEENGDIFNVAVLLLFYFRVGPALPFFFALPVDLICSNCFVDSTAHLLPPSLKPVVL